MAGTLVSFQTSGIPAYISNSLANIYTPLASPMASNIKLISVCNTTSTSCWFSLYIGGTGAGVAGTEIFKFYPVAGYTTLPFWMDRKLVSTNFLVGIAQTASALTIDVQGYALVTG
jgi:hypothetical protein